MYRDSTPHSIPGGLRAKMDTLTINTARFAEVWLDDYKHFYYYMNPGEWDPMQLVVLYYASQISNTNMKSQFAFSPYSSFKFIHSLEKK